MPETCSKTPKSRRTKKRQTGSYALVLRLLSRRRGLGLPTATAPPIWSELTTFKKCASYCAAFLWIHAEYG